MAENKQEVYSALEAGMLGYQDYCNVPVEDCGEPLIPISEATGVIATNIRDDALPITGALTYVRQGVLERLESAARFVNTALPGSVLDVGYGYRALSVQQSRFAGALATLADRYEGEELRMAAHRQVAIPEVAGHVAGAAVDLSIRQNGTLLDFGTNMWQFEDDSYTYSPYVNSEAQKNRQVLLSCMKQAGFAPFLGEWWHFSYGDKEWAAYCGKPRAIYDQLEFTTIE